MSDDNSSATKRPREFELDSRIDPPTDVRMDGRMRKRVLPSSSDAILSTAAPISRIRRYYCPPVPTTLPLPPPPRVDFPQLRRLSRFFRASGFLTTPRNTEVETEREREGERKRIPSVRPSRPPSRGREGRRAILERHDGGDSFHINNGGSSITSGGGNGRYAEMEKGAR